MTYAKERCFNTFPLETTIENDEKRRYDKIFDLRILFVIIWQGKSNVAEMQHHSLQFSKLTLFGWTLYDSNLPVPPCDREKSWFFWNLAFELLKVWSGANDTMYLIMWYEWRSRMLFQYPPREGVGGSPWGKPVVALLYFQLCGTHTAHWVVIVFVLQGVVFCHWPLWKRDMI